MLAIALVALLLIGVLPATAAADGLPAVGVDAKPLVLPDGELEYVTKRDGQDTRLIEKARYGGPLRERRVRGRFSIPAVAYDGTPVGLSADGRTLVLISLRPPHPRRQTTLAIVGTGELAVRNRVTLRGDVGVDAISPDGRMLYLIVYDPHDFGRYEVRAYDLRAGRLLPEPVVDPREAGEPMTGVPVTRLPSPDGRWAYTLYQRREHPFVHALDTARRKAVGIDLDGVRQVWNSTLSLDGHRLSVISGKGVPIARIDTRAPRRVVPGRAARAPEEDASTSWLPLAAPTAALLLLAFAARRRALKKSKVPPMTGEWEPSSDRRAPIA